MEMRSYQEHPPQDQSLNLARPLHIWFDRIVSCSG
jgi:hypothetical protein